ncbi:ABC transporter permease [Dethiosulfatarculus sandiegensis]|uniref:Permease n=1 Tax=Dethiosulfatarculus sandiegensis TaxID=1429043 RepID=A0A0D2HSV8_9BACT|nr:FtsX-like permease family protein [Dethiosulfatarculus sandiegensis]KIX13623.1 permease [Dethiosulfatarculus sandiegensis]
MISTHAKMAWRNVWRNKRRTLLTVMAISFACVLLVFMLSWQFGSYQTMINLAVMIHTGHLQVQAKGYHEDRNIRQVIRQPAEVLKLLAPLKQVKAVTTRAEAFSLLSSQDRTYGALVVGVDPVAEPGVSRLKKLVRRGEFLGPEDQNQALVGRLLAKNLKLGLGGEITILGQGKDGSIAATVVKVKGIYYSGQDDFDRASIQIPLSFFQNTYAMENSVHQVVFLVKSLDQVQTVQNALAAPLSRLKNPKPLVCLNWDQLMPGLMQSIQMDLISGSIFYAILIIVVAFSILNTFLMTIFERTGEFGVLLAMGATRGRLVKILIMESGFLTFLGISVGTILGCVITLYFQEVGLEFKEAAEMLAQFGMPSKFYPRLSFLSATLGPLAVLLVTLVTALYPAFKVRRLNIVEALGHL